MRFVFNLLHMLRPLPDLPSDSKSHVETHTAKADILTQNSKEVQPLAKCPIFYTMHSLALDILAVSSMIVL